MGGTGRGRAAGAEGQEEPRPGSTAEVHVGEKLPGGRCDRGPARSPCRRREPPALSAACSLGRAGGKCCVMAGVCRAESVAIMHRRGDTGVGRATAHSLLQPDRNVRWRAKLKCLVGPNASFFPRPSRCSLVGAGGGLFLGPSPGIPGHGGGRPGQAPQPRRGRGVSREGLRQPGGGGQAPFHGEAPDGGCRDGCAALSGSARRFGRAW